jgi:hypothetical protein
MSSHPLDPQRSFAELFPQALQGPPLDVLVTSSTLHGVLVHHLKCEFANLHGSSSTSSKTRSRLTREEVLSTRPCGSCTRMLEVSFPRIHLGPLFVLTTSDEPLPRAREVEGLAQAARRGAARLGRDASALVERHVERQLELRSRWTASSAALEALELLSASRRVDAPQVRHLAGFGAHQVPCSLASVRARAGSSSTLSALLRSHSELNRSARVLVHASSGQHLGAMLAHNGLLVSALERFSCAGEPGVMVLPRALEPLARKPEMAPKALVSVAVLQQGDSDAVLETAVKLLREGIGTSALALKAARALV